MLTSCWTRLQNRFVHPQATLIIPTCYLISWRRQSISKVPRVHHPTPVKYDSISTIRNSFGNMRTFCSPGVQMIKWLLGCDPGLKGYLNTSTLRRLLDCDNSIVDVLKCDVIKSNSVGFSLLIYIYWYSHLHSR